MVSKSIITRFVKLIVSLIIEPPYFHAQDVQSLTKRSVLKITLEI